MYNKFTTESITQIEEVCRIILQIAENKKEQKWAGTTIEKYNGLLTHLHQYKSLSPSQCGIIETGCRLNGLNVPQAIQDKINPPEPQPEPEHITVQINKEHLDEILTIAALQLSDKVFEVLQQK